ncbi:unnamed protein product [Amaranthus hypochondriacus]|jgi:hypothetical protein
MSSPNKKNPNSSPSVKLPKEKEPSPPPLPGYTRYKCVPGSVRARSVAQMRRIRGCTGGVKISSDCDDDEPVKVGQGSGSGVSSTEKATEVIDLDEGDEGSPGCEESPIHVDGDEGPSTGPGSLCGSKRVVRLVDL